VNSDYLKACAAAYLRYRRQCIVVAFERGVSGHVDNPDVLGVTVQRYLIEIEVKVSVSDFRRDIDKAKWKCPGRLCPRQFYYIVPPDISDKVLKIWPDEDRGLLTLDRTRSGGLHDVYAVKKAKAAAAKTLSTEQLVRLVKHQSGTLVSLARDKEFKRMRIEELEAELKSLKGAQHETL